MFLNRTSGLGWRGKSRPAVSPEHDSGTTARPQRTARSAFLWEKAAATQRCSARRVDEGVGRSGLPGPGWAGLASKRWESADKPGSVEDNHPSGTHVTVRLKRPTRKPLRAAGTDLKARALPYLVLLQVGFAVPPNVATGAVRSYRTLSPLPATTRLHVPRHRRFAFCCTVRGLAPPRHYLAPCPMEPGLSSTSLNAAVAWPTPTRSIRFHSPGFGGARASARS